MPSPAVGVSSVVEHEAMLVVEAITWVANKASERQRGIFAPDRIAGRLPSGSEHAVEGRISARSGMSENTVGDEPRGLAARRVGDVHIDRQRLLRIGGNEAGGQAFVEIDSNPCCFSAGIGARTVDDLNHVLLELRWRHRRQENTRLDSFNTNTTHTPSIENTTPINQSADAEMLYQHHDPARCRTRVRN